MITARLPDDKGRRAQIVFFQLLKILFQRTLPQFQAVTELSETGQVHLEIRLPGIIHNPAVHGTAIVPLHGMFIFHGAAQHNRMTLHLSHLEQRRIESIDQDASGNVFPAFAPDGPKPSS